MLYLKSCKDDLFTSLHIEEFVLEVRDTKRGVEELTNDIPNVAAEATKELDENGLIRIGAEVNEGDILIGKITPKGESDPTPEEKLLRAIFGDKAGDVKDASLKAPPSMKGVVIDKKLFSKVIKDRTTKSKEKDAIEILEKEFKKDTTELTNNLVDKLMILVSGKVSQGVYNNFKEELIPKKIKFAQKQLLGIDYLTVNPHRWTTDKQKNQQIADLINNYIIKYKELLGILNRKKHVAMVGDELPSGIVKMAKVYVARNVSLKLAIKWQVAMVTKAL